MNERTDREIVERKRLEGHTNGHFEEREPERWRGREREREIES